MDISVETEDSACGTRCLARSRLARREVTAVQLNSRAAYYVADEVVVDADGAREYVNLGGEVVRDGSDPDCRGSS